MNSAKQVMSTIAIYSFCYNKHFVCAISQRNTSLSIVAVTDSLKAANMLCVDCRTKELTNVKEFVVLSPGGLLQLELAGESIQGDHYARNEVDTNGERVLHRGSDGGQGASEAGNMGEKDGSAKRDAA
ncbi:hypothetical protein EH223_08430 [candidate division KSB1 bacterium]|nr:MAG: hypothetical protein EH223_08430 [candidate division KSB1 bacterium]